MDKIKATFITEVRLSPQSDAAGCPSLPLSWQRPPKPPDKATCFFSGLGLCNHCEAPDTGDNPFFLETLILVFSYYIPSSVFLTSWIGSFTLDSDISVLLTNIIHAFSTQRAWATSPRDSKCWPPAQNSIPNRTHPLFKYIWNINKDQTRFTLNFKNQKSHTFIDHNAIHQKLTTKGYTEMPST